MEKGHVLTNNKGLYIFNVTFKARNFNDRVFHKPEYVMVFYQHRVAELVIQFK